MGNRVDQWQSGAAAAKPVLSFDAKGGLAGGGICNRFFGGYELTGEGLTFGGMGSTQMACEQALMEEEALLLKALGKVSAFGIDSSGVLTLKGAQTVIVARRKQY
jgi:heat shock protein HslJ